MNRRGLIAIVALVIWMTAARDASAQHLGTFSWQMGPYCNVITVQVTQIADLYAIEGVDDQARLASGSPSL